ncbi:MAG: cellulase family glycosylhydrolase [Polyangiaceae bacterium]
MTLVRLGSSVALALGLAACGSDAANRAGGATGTGGSGSANGGAGAGGAAGVGGTANANGAAGVLTAGAGGAAGASAGGTSGAAGAPGTGRAGLHVVGNQLQDNGKPVRLVGWNRPGGEYSCINKEPSVFDGPTDLASVQAMKAWKGFNTLRVPLNETCWLGINGVSAAASGQNYITAVANYVALLRSNGIYVIVEMHWNAPGSFVASSQMPMADADHGLDFWSQVASKFKGDPGIIFDLYNEPHLNSVPEGGLVGGADAWSCWLNGGCTITPQTWEQQTGGYMVAGMQQMLDAVRATGATNLVLAGGLNWAGDLSGWAAHAPHDSAGNLAASGHVYYKPEDCMGAACYSTLQAFSQATQVPIVTGEVGEFDRAHTFVDGFMSWADTNNVSYLAWSWSLEPCGSPGPSYSAGPSLITDWTGAATAYGQGFKDHIATLPP